MALLIKTGTSDTVQYGSYSSNPPFELNIAQHCPQPLNFYNGATETYGNYTVLQESQQGNIIDVLLLRQETVDNATIASEEYISISGKYYYNSIGYYYRNGKNEYIQMTDFNIEVLVRQIIRSRNAVEKDNIAIRLCGIDGLDQTLSIPYEKWSKLFTILKEKIPDRLIATDEVFINQFEILAAMILCHSQYVSENIFQYWGWSELQDGGNRVFLHGGLQYCLSEKSLLPPVKDTSKKAQILSQALSILEVGPREVVSILVTYGAAAYMDRLSTDAGHFLSHAIMLLGESGMMKTSLMRVIFNLFVKFIEQITSVRSTEASLHLMTEKSYDDVLVIDDFNREGSLAEVNQKTKKHTNIMPFLFR